MEIDEELSALAASVVVLTSCKLVHELKRRRRRRRCWMWSLHPSKKVYTERNLEPEVRNELITNSYLECKMSAIDFQYLLQKIGPKISRRDTTMRKAISVEERLAVTLRFLATGEIFSSLALSFSISEQVVSAIVPEVCLRILELLGDNIKLPTSPETWKQIEQKFYQRWNFPHCVGTIVARRLLHRTRICRINILALVDADDCFTFAETSTVGVESDPYTCTTLFRALNKGELQLPPEDALPGHIPNVPYVFIGDETLPSDTHILKDYTGVYGQYSNEHIFNYQMDRVRSSSSDVFNRLATVFRCLKKPLLIQPDNVMNVWKTCIVLHNFLKRSETSGPIYAPDGETEADFELNSQPKSTMVSIGPIERDTPNVSDDINPELKYIKDEFASYFAEHTSIS